MNAGYTPPEDFLKIADAAVLRRLARVSVARETLDGQPIGWIMRLTAADSRWASIFGGDGHLSCYLDRDPVEVPVVEAWLGTFPEGIKDPQITAMFSLAIRNGWETVLETEDNSYHSPHLAVPDRLRLDATASDYESGFSREERIVSASRFEGENEFAAVLRTDHEGGGIHPVHITPDEARALLGTTAPMSVPTRSDPEDRPVR